MKLSSKEEFNLAAKTVAESQDADFPGAENDAEYTETGYAGLSSDVQAAGSWKEFHDEVGRRLAKMQGE